MVVPASDLPQSPMPAPTSQGGVGQGTPAGVPTASDSPGPSNPAGSFNGVAPEPTAPPIDVGTIPPEVRTYLESTFRDGYVPASNLSELQSRLDAQVASERNKAELVQAQLQAAQAQTQRALQRFQQYVSEVQAGTREVHPNDIAAFTLDIQQAGNQVTYTKSQAAMQHREWEQGHTAGFQGRLDREAAGDPANGIPAIDRSVIANDPDVQRLNSELVSIAQADARDLYRNPQHGARALQIQQQLEARINQVSQGARLRAVAQPATQEMQLVNQNLQRQEQRGVQTQALPGMAGLTGGYDPESAWQQSVNAVASMNNVDPTKIEGDDKLYQQVYQHWVKGYDAAKR
jgi:superfamily II RNA helicase